MEPLIYTLYLVMDLFVYSTAPLLLYKAGKDGLAFLTNGLGWTVLAFFQDKRARLGSAKSGWNSVKRSGLDGFSLTLADIL